MSSLSRDLKKCIVLSDSFKGTLSSTEIAAIARGAVPEIFPDCEVLAFPVADGGEGTVDCFLEAMPGERVAADVTGPYPGERVRAAYGRFGGTAVVEMAAAAGLPMVGERRDPSRTTTFGVGELIRHAVGAGCRSVLLGLGGSATTDGGCGCAAALGTKFYNAAGETFVPVGATLGDIAAIDNTAADALLRGVTVTVMCDVDNPLCGESGAAYVFGPQKGADEAMVRRLDDGLRRLAGKLAETFGGDFAAVPGAGAAGGMGAGCLAFLRASLRPGIEAVLDTIGFDRLLDGADLVLTGEGRFDAQSARGKVISGIARRTRARGVPLVAIVGCIDDSAAAAYDLGVTAMFAIDRMALPFSQSAARSAADYRATLLDVLRLIRG